MYEEKQFVVDTINKNIEKKMISDKTITYYDVTNYYFAIDTNDKDDGEKKSLLKIGVSKENCFRILKNVFWVNSCFVNC